MEEWMRILTTILQRWRGSAGKATSFRYDLNGIWKFHYARNYGSAILDLKKQTILCKDWDDIRDAGTYPDGRI